MASWPPVARQEPPGALPVAVEAVAVDTIEVRLLDPHDLEHHPDDEGSERRDADEVGDEEDESGRGEDHGAEDRVADTGEDATGDSASERSSGRPTRHDAPSTLGRNGDRDAEHAEHETDRAGCSGVEPSPPSTGSDVLRAATGRGRPRRPSIRQLDARASRRGGTTRSTTSGATAGPIAIRTHAEEDQLQAQGEQRPGGHVGHRTPRRAAVAGRVARRQVGSHRAASAGRIEHQLAQVRQGAGELRIAQAVPLASALGFGEHQAARRHDRWFDTFGRDSSNDWASSEG